MWMTKRFSTLAYVYLFLIYHRDLQLKWYPVRGSVQVIFWAALVLETFGLLWKTVNMPGWLVTNIQCRHLIPALNTWAARAEYTTARPIANQFPGHWCMDNLTTENSFISKLRGSLMCLAYSLHIINGYLSNQTLADVRSTGAGIKCLYCKDHQCVCY